MSFQLFVTRYFWAVATVAKQRTRDKCGFYSILLSLTNCHLLNLPLAFAPRSNLNLKFEVILATFEGTSGYGPGPANWLIRWRCGMFTRGAGCCYGREQGDAPSLAMTQQL